MAASSVDAQIESLARQLASFHGYRTVWLDLGGRLCHAEPDELLEELGYLYVGTFLRPATDDLEEAVARHVTVAREPAKRRGKLWGGLPAELGADLAPAEA